MVNAEQQRLEENKTREEPWHFWGPYLAERAWGTVREDYSANGDAWNFFPHEHARSRAYRWNEDGIGGISDHRGRLCFAFAFWNERDPFLKERLFGLSGPEGNHGEDVKELYWYADSTPTHSFMRMIYRYPQSRFPYEELVGTNKARSKMVGEFEIRDTNAFAENRYFDIEIEYAKANAHDILIRLNAKNCGPESAPLHLLPTIWFRNTWGWSGDENKPALRKTGGDSHIATITASHPRLGDYELICDSVDDVFFTENESNAERLWGLPNAKPFVKDSINDHLVNGKIDSVNAEQFGTKAAAHYKFNIPAGETISIRLRLTRDVNKTSTEAFGDFDSMFKLRRAEADQFYNELAPKSLSEEPRTIQRQAFAGLLWNKQFYHYIVEQWLDGDPGAPKPPEERLSGRNAGWRHLYNERVMSMPDKWEFPWYASWDLAFHCIPLALIDVQFAKKQIDLIVREWYLHPSGKIPAYEWNFDDVNPPVLAWAAWRVYQIERKQTGKGDRAFLETIFHKMLIAFTWWVNRKDSEGNNIFQGGFLGLDNIGVFDRSTSFADGTRLEQSDATSWMGMFCLNLMRIAIELALENHVYENIATKFFEHFLGIAAAMNNLGGRGIGLWNEEDEFYYDVLHTPGGRYLPLKVRSVVGLLPLFAVETIQWQLIEALPGFKSRLEWYLEHRPELASLVSRWQEPGMKERRLVAITRGHRMKCLLRRMLDPNEFLSDYGIRSVSKYHKDHPYVLNARGETRVVNYEPAESQTGIFGGNSNWRGPIWFPINYLLIESLQQFHHYYGDDFKVECPTGSGNFMHLRDVANELSNRLIKIWRRDENGECAFSRTQDRSDRYLFHEYFHADTGAGLGASHQCGWTALVAKLIQQQGEFGTIR
ncbi:MAG: glucosidase [Verrucomicrobia bacterium]|nr:MAG: glucosidase [Verrucomicrobiota bacterium]